MAYVITALCILAVLILALAVCIASDRIENKWRLNKVKCKLASFANSTDAEFLQSFPAENHEAFRLMRTQFAKLFEVATEKIHADWDFSSEPHIRPFIPIIFGRFAKVHAPDSLAHFTFQFPEGRVRTVKELFLEAIELQNSKQP